MIVVFEILQRCFQLLMSGSLSRECRGLLCRIGATFTPVYYLGDGGFPIFSCIFITVRTVLYVGAPLLVMFCRWQHFVGFFACFISCCRVVVGFLVFVLCPGVW